MTLAEKTMREPRLEFDADSHAYKLNGSVIPSVTQIIQSVLPINLGPQSDAQKEYYMQRGAALHHGCHLVDEGRLDWSSVAPEIEGRMRAWQKFKEELNPTLILANEHQMFHPMYRFAGTLDRVFSRDDEVIVADIKSSISPQVALQLAAYRLLWNRAAVDRGVAVELRDDGTYSTLWINKKELDLTERTFLACLSIHNFKQKEKIQ